MCTALGTSLWAKRRKCLKETSSSSCPCDNRGEDNPTQKTPKPKSNKPPPSPQTTPLICSQYVAACSCVSKAIRMPSWRQRFVLCGKVCNPGRLWVLQSWKCSRPGWTRLSQPGLVGGEPAHGKAALGLDGPWGALHPSIFHESDTAMQVSVTPVHAPLPHSAQRRVLSQNQKKT